MKNHSDAHAHFDGINLFGKNIQPFWVDCDFTFIAISRIQIMHAIHTTKQCGLSATTGSDQGRRLIAIDRQCHFFHNLLVAIKETQIFNFCRFIQFHFTYQLSLFRNRLRIKMAVKFIAKVINNKMTPVAAAF